MDQLLVITHPEPLKIDARPIRHEAVPDGAIGLGYYHSGNLIARGVVAPEAVDAIRMLLSAPVSVALAATEDEGGNIDARVCLVLPVDPEKLKGDEDEEPDEPWKASVPPPPTEVEDGYGEGESDETRLALLPIGSVVRAARDRRHPDDAKGDVSEMLDNLLGGRAKDAVAKAIDDLLDSL